MEQKQNEEWNAITAQYQEEVHASEYSPGSAKDTHHYAILQHEYVVIFERNSGQFKVVKPTLNEEAEK